MSPQLIITPKQVSEIAQFAEQAYPEECCGLLIGQRSPQRIIIMSLYPTRNAWQEQQQDIELDPTNPPHHHSTHHSTHDRFIIDPAEQLAAMKQSRAIGQEIVGVYHSHPNHPAIPSATDRQMAWPEYVYWITAVAPGVTGKAQAIAHRCWQLQANGDFAEVRHPVQ